MMTRFNKLLTLVALFLMIIVLILGFTNVLDNVGSYLEVIGVVWLGLFTNSVISESGIVNENSRVLREIGIKEVSTIGFISDMDMDDLFSRSKIIKICVISGIGFLRIHEDALIKALKAGAEVQILTAKIGSEFLNDLTAQLRAIAHKKDDDTFDVTQVEEIKNAEKKVAEWQQYGKIEIRHYNSEYRTKFILGIEKESEDNKGKIYGYYNFGLPIRAPKEYPLFSGSIRVADMAKYEENVPEEERAGAEKRNNKELHFIVDLNLHFDYLWNKYAPKTEA